MENININSGIENDLSSEEDELDCIETDAVEMNPLENKDNDHLLVGIFGNGSGFLKSSLYIEMKNNNKSFKIKFMSKHSKNNTKAKKVCAELYQFTNNNVNHLVLHTKQNLVSQNYKFIVDYLKNNGIVYKRVAVFDSVHKSDFFGEVGVYCVKNSMQLKSNQLIRCQNLPSPNTIQGFSAYLLTYNEVIDVPSVVYLMVSSHYDVCIDGLNLFNPTTISYVFLRNKLSEEYFNNNGITKSAVHLLLKEYNSSKNLVYT